MHGHTYRGHQVDLAEHHNRRTATVHQSTYEGLTEFGKPPKPPNPPPPPPPPPQPIEGYGSKKPSVHPTETFTSGGHWLKIR